MGRALNIDQPAVATAAPPRRSKLLDTHNQDRLFWNIADAHLQPNRGRLRSKRLIEALFALATVTRSDPEVLLH